LPAIRYTFGLFGYGTAGNEGAAQAIRALDQTKVGLAQNGKA